MSTPEGTNPFDQPDWPLEPCSGDTHTDDQGRSWRCWAITYGVKGGRWGYSTPGQGLVVDTRQNLQSTQFQGMLAVPWDGLTKLGWVLGKQWCQPVVEKLEPEPVDSVRFERLEQPPEES